MDELSVGTTARPVGDWPTAHLRRAYRFAVADVRAASAAGRFEDVAQSEQEAALFALELVRRGEL